MSGRKKPKKPKYAGAEPDVLPGEANWHVDALPDLGPFNEDVPVGMGLDPELIELEMISLEDFPRIGRFTSEGGKLTPRLREFLAERVRLRSISDHLRAGGEVTPLVRSILAEVCQNPELVIRRRGWKLKRVYHRDFRLVMLVADLMLREGLSRAAAFNRLVADKRTDATAEQLKDALKRWRKTPFAEWVGWMLAESEPPTEEELEREEQLSNSGLTWADIFPRDRGVS